MMDIEQLAELKVETKTRMIFSSFVHTSANAADLAKLLPLNKRRIKKRAQCRVWGIARPHLTVTIIYPNPNINVK